MFATVFYISKKISSILAPTPDFPPPSQLSPPASSNTRNIPPSLKKVKTRREGKNDRVEERSINRVPQ